MKKHTGVVKWAVAFWLMGVTASWAGITINEIHYDPPLKTARLEFIELHNSGTSSIDLSGWKFTKGIRYEFPANTSIEAGGFIVIAENPAALQEHFGTKAVGPWEGKLKNGGEEIVLSASNGEVADQVHYQFGFPWPYFDSSELEPAEHSIELIHPSLDNDIGGSWRGSHQTESGPTPGAKNSAFSEVAGPQLSNVSHEPSSPKSDTTVTITIEATDPEGVAEMVLQYQIVDPGDYFSRADDRYGIESSWTAINMTAPGKAKALYTATIPSVVQKHRRLVHYRFRATDSKGAVIFAPHKNDPQLNFAYFVYDRVPGWKGALEPNRPGSKAVTFAADVLTSVPVYHLLAAQDDVEQSQLGGYRGSDYLWTGTLVYDGRVYDHIGYRPRGGTHRFKRGKNFWKFNFHRGHRLRAKDNYGDDYSEKWDKLNLSPVMQNTERRLPFVRGEMGLFEATTFRMFQLAGVPASSTHYLHFRVIDTVEEQSARSQYVGDFNGLYLAIEQPDSRFLDAHGLPDGNLYKMEFYAGTKKVQAPNLPSDGSDLEAFKRGFSRNPSTDWWQQNFELSQYHSYRSIVEAARHYDIMEGKNYYYFHNGKTSKWHVLPWDVDLTWAEGQWGTGEHAFSSLVAKNPAFQQHYFNRQREILDLLFNEDQAGMLIDELAGIIYTPQAPSISQADYYLWEHHPYAQFPGESYKYSGDTRKNPNVGSIIRHMKAFVKERRQWITKRILTDEKAIPKPPLVAYAGKRPAPSKRTLALSIDQIAFKILARSSTRQPIVALKWRIAEVTNPKSAAFDPAAPRQYEIEPLWESEELPTQSIDAKLPAEITLKQGALYRMRARAKDKQSRWSHWTSPIEFVAKESR